MLPAFYKYDISDPREIEACARLVGDEALARIWIVAATADEHIKRMQPRLYAERVLPKLKQ
jgi:hypothetical protein